MFDVEAIARVIRGEIWQQSGQNWDIEDTKNNNLQKN